MYHLKVTFSPPKSWITTCGLYTSAGNLVTFFFAVCNNRPVLVIGRAGKRPEITVMCVRLFIYSEIPVFVFENHFWITFYCLSIFPRSVGCILYELFVGTPPFYTNSIFQLVNLICRVCVNVLIVIVFANFSSGFKFYGYFQWYLD